MGSDTPAVTPEAQSRRRIIAGSVLIAIAVVMLITDIHTTVINAATRFRAMQISHEPDRLWENTFFGVTVQQFPAEFVTYQEVIWEQRPDVIVETGTFWGGNAAYLASVLAFANPEGRVVTIDITDVPWNETLAKGQLPREILDRITFIKGDSVGDETLAQVRKLTEGKKVMVVLDSLHKRDHVLKELQLYSPLIPVGGYIIVNDGQLEVALWSEFYKDGPASAREDFLASTDAYVLDESRPKSFISNTWKGYIKRVK